MEKLIAELKRLYLIDQPGAPHTSDLAAHLRGETTIRIDLADENGMARALVLEFHKTRDDAHWQRLCEVANALQHDLGLPAPAVSVSGGSSYGLWLSFEAPLPPAQLREFHALLHKAYFGDEEVDFGKTMVELPPCRHRETGLWAAFINPGMGASFAEELGLEMTPPIGAQSQFLEGLRSITAKELAHAFDMLQAKVDGDVAALAQPALAPTPASQTTPSNKAGDTSPGLLLKDASIEDIVRHLQARNIEPTLRFLK